MVIGTNSNEWTTTGWCAIDRLYRRLCHQMRRALAIYFSTCSKCCMWVRARIYVFVLKSTNLCYYFIECASLCFNVSVFLCIFLLNFGFVLTFGVAFIWCNVQNTDKSNETHTHTYASFCVSFRTTNIQRTRHNSCVEQLSSCEKTR